LEAAQPASPTSELNWTSIIDESMQEETPAAAAAAVLTEISETEMTDPSADRRQAFIDKLQKRSAAPAEPEDIPDWVLEESQLNQPESSSDFIAIPSEPEALEDVNLPDIPEESGIIDHDIPVEIPEELAENPASTQWVQDQPVDSGKEVPPISLQDTQQIRVHREETPEEKLEQAKKALEGENVQYALNKIREISDDDRYLAQIKDLLETACQTNPDNANLWLTLGNIYQRLDMKEKALEVFIRAQKQISL
jgi:tetratricopeptide (TPR) repeat protein